MLGYNGAKTRINVRAHTTDALDLSLLTSN
jgi:hypothetical protein